MFALGLYSARVCSITLYGIVLVILKQEYVIRVERNVARNFRRLCSDSPEDMISAEECRTRLKLGTG